MIYLRVDYSKNLACPYSIFVNFQYNEYYLNLIKSFKPRAWDNTNKIWELDYEQCYTPLINTLNNYNIPYNSTQFMESISDLIKKVEAGKVIQTSIHEVDTSILDNVDFKTKPRDYQLQGIAYGIQTPRFLLADEQGLGKSLQCLNIAIQTKKAPHCLVIVGYDALQFNWVCEVEKHTYEKGYVLGQREYKRGKNKGTYKCGSLKERYDDLCNIHNIDEYFLITSVATIRDTIKTEYTDSKGKKKKHHNYYVADKIEELCKQGLIDRIIVDEGQVFKTYDNIQTTALLRLKEAPNKIIATGTPIMNKHLDLYPLMTWLGYEHSNYYSFRSQYCQMGGFKNKQVIGNKNGDLLNQKLSSFMLRRKKADVLDLPDKIYIDESLEMDLKQATLYNKIKKEVKRDLIKMKGNKALLLAAFIKLRQVTCHPCWVDEKYRDSVKFERVHYLMNEINENGQKAIIFSNWSTPINLLKEELKMYNPAVITGDTKDRIQQVNLFQNEDSCRLILGTIGAMGTGLTLTAASNIIFIDEPWNRALKDQATDRAHRIGTKNNVNIYTLICRNTVDEKVHNTVLKKGMIADNVVDGISMEELEKLLTEETE